MSIVLTLALAVATAKVYRCETDTEIVFQQSPCAMADEPVALRPESSFGGRAAPPSVKRPKNADRPARVIREASSAPRRETECENARTKRDAAYAERGNTMTFDERRKLQDRMDEACGLR